MSAPKSRGNSIIKKLRIGPRGWYRYAPLKRARQARTPARDSRWCAVTASGGHLSGTNMFTRYTGIILLKIFKCRKGGRQLDFEFFNISYAR